MENNPVAFVPPQNLQAEASVIGGCLIDADAYGRISDALSVDDFYDHNHKIIFNAISALVASGSGVDVLLVDEYLKSKGLSERIGGLQALGHIAINTPTAANIAHYAKIVRTKAVQRTIIETARDLTEQAMNASVDDVEGIISQAESTIFALGQRGIRGQTGFVRMRKVLGDVVDRMEQDFAEPPKTGIKGLPSGFTDLDRLTSGPRPGNLVIVAARPGQGKTTFAMNMAEHCALVQGKPVAVFSMEMSKEELVERSLSSVSGTELGRVRESWRLQDSDWTLLNAGLSRMANSPIFIDDTAGLSMAALRSRTMRLASELSTEFPDGLGSVVVDYIQLMGADRATQGENRNGQIEAISRGLKQLAKELGCPVFALSQLNRNVESRPNKRPVMSDLRDSGSIEQDADLILFLYRDEVYNKDSIDVGIAEVIIGKQRNGPLGTVRLQFDGACVRFRDFAGVGYEL